VDLDRRRGADGKILKALRTAGDTVRSEAEFRSWLGDFGRRAEIREAEDSQRKGSERNRLRPSSMEPRYCGRQCPTEA
jgi:hypothetical protein